MSLPPTHSSVQLALKNSATAFEEQQRARGFSEFKTVCCNSKKAEHGVYGKLWEVLNKPLGNPEFGRQAFHDADGKTSTMEQKADAIVRFMLATGQIPSELVVLNQKTQLFSLSEKALKILEKIDYKIDSVINWEPNNPILKLPFRVAKLTMKIASVLLCLKYGFKAASSAANHLPESLPKLNVPRLPKDWSAMALANSSVPNSVIDTTGRVSVGCGHVLTSPPLLTNLIQNKPLEPKLITSPSPSWAGTYGKNQYDSAPKPSLHGYRSDISNEPSPFWKRVFGEKAETESGRELSKTTNISYNNLPPNSSISYGNRVVLGSGHSLQKETVLRNLTNSTLTSERNRMLEKNDFKPDGKVFQLNNTEHPKLDRLEAFNPAVPDANPSVPHGKDPIALRACKKHHKPPLTKQEKLREKAHQEEKKADKAIKKAMGYVEEMKPKHALSKLAEAYRHKMRQLKLSFEANNDLLQEAIEKTERARELQKAIESLEKEAQEQKEKILERLREKEREAALREDIARRQGRPIDDNFYREQHEIFENEKMRDLEPVFRDAERCDYYELQKDWC